MEHMSQEIINLISEKIDDFETLKNFTEVFAISDFSLYKSLIKNIRLKNVDDDFLREHKNILRFLKWKDLERVMLCGEIQSRPVDVQMLFYSSISEKINWKLVGMEYGYNRALKKFPFSPEFKHIESITTGRLCAMIDEILGNY